MNLSNLPNDKLVSCFENAVRSERKITAQVLAYIAEIDRRKLYLEKGTTSLFDYLVRDYGYSPGAAMRRIDAARLLRELPDAAEKFESGTLTISQANQIQRAAREFKKHKSKKLSTDIKRDLVLLLESKTQKQTEQLLATNLDLPAARPQKQTYHRDQSVTLTVTFTSAQIQVLEQVQNMISHSVTSKDWAEVFTYLAKKEVARRTVRISTLTAATTVKSTSGSTSSTAPKLSTVRPPIPSRIRKTLLNIDATCEHKDSNGRQCGSQRFLQIDHIHSWSRGGTHDPKNLQVLCGTHNRLKYVKESGDEQTAARLLRATFVNAVPAGFWWSI
jgi:5-methylcytosine-specific restriction endonuclease McrA